MRKYIENSRTAGEFLLPLVRVGALSKEENLELLRERDEELNSRSIDISESIVDALQLCELSTDLLAIRRYFGDDFWEGATDVLDRKSVV